MYFPKQHNEWTVTEKLGTDRSIASLFPQILHYNVYLPSMQRVDVILNDKGRNSFEENAIVSDSGARALLRHQSLLLHNPNVVNR